MSVRVSARCERGSGNVPIFFISWYNISHGLKDISGSFIRRYGPFIPAHKPRIRGEALLF